MRKILLKSILTFILSHSIGLSSSINEEDQNIQWRYNFPSDLFNFIFHDFVKEDKKYAQLCLYTNKNYLKNWANSSMRFFGPRSAIFLYQYGIENYKTVHNLSFSMCPVPKPFYTIHHFPNESANHLHTDYMHNIDEDYIKSMIMFYNYKTYTRYNKNLKQPIDLKQINVFFEKYKKMAAMACEILMNNDGHLEFPDPLNNLYYKIQANETLNSLNSLLNKLPKIELTKNALPILPWYLESDSYDLLYNFNLSVDWSRSLGDFSAELYQKLSNNKNLNLKISEGSSVNDFFYCLKYLNNIKSLSVDSFPHITIEHLDFGDSIPFIKLSAMFDIGIHNTDPRLSSVRVGRNVENFIVKIGTAFSCVNNWDFSEATSLKNLIMRRCSGDVSDGNLKIRLPDHHMDSIQIINEDKIFDLEELLPRKNIDQKICKILTVQGRTNIVNHKSFLSYFQKIASEKINFVLSCSEEEISNVGKYYESYNHLLETFPTLPPNFQNHREKNITISFLRSYTSFNNKFSENTSIIDSLRLIIKSKKNGYFIALQFVGDQEFERFKSFCEAAKKSPVNTYIFIDILGFDDL